MTLDMMSARIFFIFSISMCLDQAGSRPGMLSSVVSRASFTSASASAFCFSQFHISGCVLGMGPSTDMRFCRSSRLWRRCARTRLVSSSFSSRATSWWSMYLRESMVCEVLNGMAAILARKAAAVKNFGTKRRCYKNCEGRKEMRGS